MRISRQSVGRRKGSLLDIISSGVSRTRRSVFQAHGNNNGSWLWMLIATCIFIVSAITLSRSNNDDNRQLRYSGTMPTHVPKSIVETVIEKFDRKDFQTKHLIPPPDTTVILFYNLYIPHEKEAVHHVIEVVNEQLGQVTDSLQKLKADKRGAVLYYNLIGNEVAFPEEKMQALCNELSSKLTCKQIGYYTTASESVTLQDMYDYCQRDEVANARVTYLHAKGSYHQTLVNTNWRRTLTDAVIHEDCLFPPDDKCNVCGAQFYTRFATMFPGNMFTAKCSYVKKLLPPLEGGEYDRLKHESVVKFLKYRLWGQLNTTLLEDRVDYFGLGRYRLEHWIGSHPDIQPCDLHREDATLETMITGKIKPETDYKWGMGPRRYDVVDENRKAKRLLKTNKDAQFREYFYLPGNLLKWFTLYGAIPTDESWQWEFFPGGDRWKELVDKYKVNAVEEMVIQSSPKFHSAFASNDYNQTKFQIHEEDEKAFSDKSTPPPLVVFYHISVPENRKLGALQAMKSQIEVLTLGQYDIISRSYRRQRPVILYYTLAGDVLDPNINSKMHAAYIDSMCKNKPNLTCRKLGDFKSANVNGETLHHLHDFCLAKPELSVTYISNQLPQLHGVNATDRYALKKIRAYTTAVTSKMCLKSRETCNVCGTEFYPLPFNHFIGNMFTATCDYVKDLLPPEKFEAAMNDSAGNTLVSKLRGAITTELFQFTPQTLGLNQYSVEHWIGSDPDFKPCDVAPVRHSIFPIFSGGSYAPNDYRGSQAYDFQWALAPRRSSAPDERRLKRWRENRAVEKDDIAYREYHYLAGNLFRWYKLYSKAPPPNSWVWKWYPRGEEWMHGTKRYGSSVVENLSRQWWDEGVPF